MSQRVNLGAAVGNALLIFGCFCLFGRIGGGIMLVIVGAVTLWQQMAEVKE